VSAVVDARELFAVYPSATGGVAALQGLSLSLEEDETCVVLGPSGSGKTTLMRVVAGLARPSAGSLVVAGHDLRFGDRFRRTFMGMRWRLWRRRKVRPMGLRFSRELGRRCGARWMRLAMTSCG